MSKRAILYARVSTTHQAEVGRSIPTQLEAMRQYCTRNNFIVAAEFIDEGISGTIPLSQRPNGAALYANITHKKVDAVIFFSIDRMTRDEYGIDVNELRRDLRAANMELHFTDSGKSDLTGDGWIIDNVKAWGAAQERNKIIERNKRGRIAKAAAGKWVGEGKPPYGYTKVGQGKTAQLEINPETAPVVRRIFDLYTGKHGQAPMPTRRISEVLSNEDVPRPQGGQYWCNRTINIILTQPAYMGKMLRYGNIVVPIAPIISEEQFEAAQARKQLNRKSYTRNVKNFYLLRGAIRCTCGRAMSARLKASKYAYYGCSSMFLPKVAKTCNERLIRADVIDTDVWEWLTELLCDEQALISALAHIENQKADEILPKRERLTQIETAITKLERKITAHVSLYADATEIELKNLRDEVKKASISRDNFIKERERLTLELDQTTLSADKQRDLIQATAIYRDLIPNADEDSRRYIIERLEVICQVQRHANDHLTAEVSCNLGHASLSLNPLHLKTTHPRRDTRIAPQIPTP